MKTIIKQLAAATLIALLLVGNVNANGTEIKASGHENIETSLQLENWMTDTETWSISTQFATETEAAMEVEGWMTNEELWNEHQSVVEEAMEVEDWMTDKNIWE